MHKHKSNNLYMIRSPEELIKPIKEAVDRKAVLFSHVLLTLTITAHILLNPSSAGYQKGIVIGLCFTMILLVIFGFFDLSYINRHPKAHLGTYALVAFFAFAFITSPASPYSLVIFSLIFIANLYYGNMGVNLIIGVFALTSIAKYIYLANVTDAPIQDKLNIVVTFLVFVAVSNLFINFQKIFDWDRARLRDTIKESAVEQKRMRALINNMTESVLVLDKEGIIRLYNAAALALFDTNNSLSDKPLDGFVKLEDEKGKIITTHDLMPPDTKPVLRDDIVLRYGSEDTAALSIVVTPIRSTFGQEKDEAGYVMTLRDITREKSLEEERDEFISVISHELRTPVTVAEAGVSNALLLVDKLQGNEKIKDSLKNAHDQAVYLANMLNDLSTFARAEKGTLDVNLEEFDPRELLERLGHDYKSAVEAKKMSIVIAPDPSTPLRMASNRLYIREILQNFITNSIKYSDKGTITISARAKDKGVLFSVADQGIGISTSDQKKIFEKFFRAEDYRTRSTNGTGLGLYITKKLAKILDAGFEVQSEVGVGSTFSVYIPDKSDILAAKHKAALPLGLAPRIPSINDSQAAHSVHDPATGPSAPSLSTTPIVPKTNPISQPAASGFVAPVAVSTEIPAQQTVKIN